MRKDVFHAFHSEIQEFEQFEQVLPVGSPELADLQSAVTVKAHSIARSHMRGRNRALFPDFHLLFVLLLKDLNI